MLDFAVKLTSQPWTVEDGDREKIAPRGIIGSRHLGHFGDCRFFNMSNRVASATNMRPNSVYHGMAR